MLVRETTENKELIGRAILEALPEWFGIPESTEEYIADLTNQRVLVAEDDGETVGFLSLKQHNDINTEIAVIGVLPSYELVPT